MSWIDWQALGIDPTTDRSAIRRAYATRLKAMDVDADPDGFADLREARDAALAAAAGTAADSEPEMMAITVPPRISAPPPPEPATDPGEAAFRAAIEAHFHALEALLFPDHDSPATPEERAAIAHHGGAMLADPRLEQVDFAAGAERWFAERLAASIPRSDPLLEPAAATFGWIDRRDDYALSGEALTIVERIGATRFAAKLADPSHRLHRAWRELNREDATRRSWRNPATPRRELLSIIRSSYPQVETWLAHKRVAETDADEPGLKIPFWLILAAFLVVVRIVAGSGDPSRVTVPPPVVLPAPTVAPPSPVVPQAVPDAHRSDRISGLTHAPAARIRDIARWEIEAMRHYEGFDPAQCVDTTIWRYDPRLAESTDARRLSLIAAVRSHARSGVAATPSRQYALRDGMVEAIRRETGFTTARMTRALNGDGPIEDQCKVQIGMRDAALAIAPKVGDRLLRRLQLARFGG